MNNRCPTCRHLLDDVEEAERERVSGKKFDDEEIKWCPRCQEYILEEDFLFNNEE